MDQDKGKVVPELPLAKWIRRLFVSQSNVTEVIRYIEGQKKHHRTKTFQEEFGHSSRNIEYPTTSGMSGIE